MKGALAEEFHRLMREMWCGKFTKVRRRRVPPPAARA
jgi:hypothetical protein